MFAVTGYFKGESVEEKTVSAKELMELFGVPQPINEVEIFERNKSKKNKLTGEEQAPLSQGLVCFFEATTPDGEPIKIRYFRNKTKKDRDRVVYEPHNYKIKARTTIATSKRLEEYVFLYIHPRNAKSPVASKMPWYTHVNVAENVEKEYKSQMALKAVLAQIDIADDDKVIIIAKGFKTKNAEISVGSIEVSKDDKIRSMAARTQLTRMAQLYPNEVAVAMGDDVTYIRGMVQEAIDRNYLKSEPVPGGAKIWKWINGQEILRTKAGEDAKVALINYAISAEGYLNFHENFSKVRGVAVQNEEILTGAKARDLGSIAVIKKAADENLLKYAHDSGAVMIHDKSDEDKWRTLIKIDPGDENWMLTLNNKIQPQQSSQIAKILEWKANK